MGGMAGDGGGTQRQRSIRMTVSGAVIILAVFMFGLGYCYE